MPGTRRNKGANTASGEDKESRDGGGTRLEPPQPPRHARAANPTSSATSCLAFCASAYFFALVRLCRRQEAPEEE
jgi:hypothetical protein